MTQIIAQKQNFTQLTDNIVVFCDQNKQLLNNANSIDNQLDNTISAFLDFADFKAKSMQCIKTNIIKNNKLTNVIIVSLGDLDKLNKLDYYQLGLKISAFLRKEKAKVSSIIHEEEQKFENMVKIAQAIKWHNYSFTEWKSKSDSADLLEVFLQTKHAYDELNKELNSIDTTNEAVKLARDLVNRPANIVTPEYLAEEAKKLKTLGVKVTVLDKKKIEKLGLNLLLSVGKGSANEPKLVIMEYYGAGKGAENYALVGKGITFDTGGYSLKPSDMMKLMKSDMGGAAATLGTIKSLAESKTPINVIGVMACAENMISSTAVKVSDVHKSYNGLTVENNNTDAEGRLVLADGISYVINNYDIAEVIDIATLTGACMVALGAEYAGVMGYDQCVVDSLIQAGLETEEKLWQLPNGKAYAEQLKSDIADLSNIGGPYAGATTASEFLYKFVDDKPWAHLDIAGVAFAGKVPGSLNSAGVKGATGFGVRLLTKYYQNKTK